MIRITGKTSVDGNSNDVKIAVLNPNNAGLFEGSFFCGLSQFYPPFIFQEELININVTVYNC